MANIQSQLLQELKNAVSENGAEYTRIVDAFEDITEYIGMDPAELFLLLKRAYIGRLEKIQTSTLAEKR